MAPAEVKKLPGCALQCRDKNVAMEQKVCFDRMINREQIDVSEVSGNHTGTRDPIYQIAGLTIYHCSIEKSQGHCEENRKKKNEFGHATWSRSMQLIV